MAQDLSERFSERAVQIVNEPLRSSSASPATREGKQKHSEAPLGDPGARDPAPSLAGVRGGTVTSGKSLAFFF